MSNDWCAHGPSIHCKDCEIERLTTELKLYRTGEAYTLAAEHIAELKMKRKHLLTALKNEQHWRGELQERIATLEERQDWSTELQADNRAKAERIAQLEGELEHYRKEYNPKDGEHWGRNE